MLSQKPPSNPDVQARTALDSARAQESTARAALHQAGAQHMAAETERVRTVTQLAPVEAGLKVAKLQADIEKTRADAANALQNAGLTEDDMRFKQAMAAVDAALGIHGAVTDHVQGLHDRQMDVIGQQQEQMQQPQPQWQPA